MSYAVDVESAVGSLREGKDTGAILEGLKGKGYDLDQRLIILEEAKALVAKENELVEKTGVTGEDLKNIGTGLGGLGLVLSALGIGDKDAPTPPSAAETYKELAEVTYDPENIRRQQEATRQATFGGDKYRLFYDDPSIQQEFMREYQGGWRPDKPAEETGRPDFMAWFDGYVEKYPLSDVAKRAGELTSSLGMEQRQREMRLEEAKRLAGEYDPTQFMSEDAKAAHEYAVGLGKDPLAQQVRSYLKEELIPIRDPDYFRETSEAVMAGMDPSRLRTSQGVAQAVLGTEREERARKQQAVSGATQFLAGERAYAPTAARLAQGTDWLQQVGLGPMTPTQVTPYDPTGAFFASFPAMQQQSALAEYTQTPTFGQRMTSLGQGLEMLTSKPQDKTYGLPQGTYQLKLG